MFLGSTLAKIDESVRTVGNDDIIAGQKGFGPESFRNSAPSLRKARRKENRSRKVYRDVPPRVIRTLAVPLKEAFGAPGLMLAAKEREDVQKDTEEDVQEGDQNADEKGDDGGDSE